MPAMCRIMGCWTKKIQWLNKISTTKKQDDDTIAEKDQVEDDVGNAGYVPNQRMLTKENTMTQQNFNNNKN
jgi:hypothetical protein